MHEPDPGDEDLAPSDVGRELDRSQTLRETELREAEKARIARDVHDRLGASLTILKMNVANLEARLDGDADPGRELVATIREEIDDLFDKVRDIASELRPPMLQDGDFEALIRWYVGRFEKRTGIGCDAEIRGEASRLGSPQDMMAFRVVQEALTNVARHADAENVRVLVEAGEDDRLRVVVEDDGDGIDVDAIRDRKTLGILSMRERAEFLGGHLDIGPRPDGPGTRVELRIPVIDGS